MRLIMDYAYVLSSLSTAGPFDDLHGVRTFVEKDSAHKTRYGHISAMYVLILE